jgi:hypothetical protein
VTQIGRKDLDEACTILMRYIHDPRYTPPTDVVKSIGILCAFVMVVKSAGDSFERIVKCAWTRDSKNEEPQ